jgi:hypothetical protein
MTNSVLGVRNIQHTNGTDAMTIDTSGKVTFENGTSYRPGEIIEMLTHSCDGTTMYGADSRSYTWPNVTATQDFGTSYADLTGSSIAYTPPTGAKTVLYRFMWMYEDQGYGGISHYRFYIDSTEVTAAYTNLAYNYDSGGNGHGQNMAVFEYTIDCAASSTSAAAAQFTSWTANKTLKIQAREYSSSYRARAHYNGWRDGTGASSPYNFRRPTLTLVAIA